MTMTSISRTARVAAVFALALAACGKQAPVEGDGTVASSDPALSQGVPDDSSYTAAAGRKEAGAAATASASGGGSLTTTARDFVNDAAEADLLEIEAGRLAATRADSAQVKQFAAMLVQDHGHANRRLAQIAEEKGVTVPRTLPAGEQQPLSELRSASGAEFDRIFSRQMVEGHTKAVTTFEEAARSVTDPQIKAFAAEQLPTLRRHLKLAQALPGAAERG